MKIFFASDVHLGASAITDKRRHEKIFIDWLDAIKHEADEIYLLGDIFDYWFEYKTVAPRGFVRLLGKLCELTDSGIKVHIFTGNHDVWIYDYLPSECGVEVHRKPYEFECSGKIFYVGHGDGLGNYDKSYNLLKWLFENKVAQFLYSLLHPDFSGWIAHTWSRKSRKHNNKNTQMHSFLGPDKEHQILFAKEYIKEHKIDYFVFGHRHIVVDYPINEQCRVLTIGDWLCNFSYAVFDGEDVKIIRWPVEGNLME